MDKDERNSIDNAVDGFVSIRKTMQWTLISAGVGLVGGAAAGLYAADELNDYAETLRQAPSAIKYCVDAAGAIVGGSVGAGVCGTVAQFVGMYKTVKKLF